MPKERMPDVETKAEIEDWKGQAILKICKPGKEVPEIAFGIRKARYIVRHHEDIVEFVRLCEEAEIKKAQREEGEPA